MRKVTWSSGVTWTSGLKGGTLIAISAKLILRAKRNGTTKKISRKSSGGRMISQRPCASIQRAKRVRGRAFMSARQQDGAVGIPAQIDLVAPVDRPRARAPAVLRRAGDQLARGDLDPVGRMAAEIAQFP